MEKPIEWELKLKQAIAVVAEKMRLKYAGREFVIFSGRRKFL